MSLLDEIVVRDPVARRDITRMILNRMGVLAEQLAGAEREGRSDLALLEEFVALGWQVGLDVPPPSLETQVVLDGHGLLIRPYQDPEADPTPEEVEEMLRDGHLRRDDDE